MDIAGAFSGTLFSVIARFNSCARHTAAAAGANHVPGAGGSNVNSREMIFRCWGMGLAEQAGEADAASSAVVSENTAVFTEQVRG